MSTEECIAKLEIMLKSNFICKFSLKNLISDDSMRYTLLWVNYIPILVGIDAMCNALSNDYFIGDCYGCKVMICPCYFLYHLKNTFRVPE